MDIYDVPDTNYDDMTIEPEIIDAMDQVRRKVLAQTLKEINAKSCSKLLQSAIDELDEIQTILQCLLMLAVQASDNESLEEERERLALKFGSLKMELMKMMRRANKLITEALHVGSYI